MNQFDGVRRYINTAKSAKQGANLANVLQALGANVTLIEENAQSAEVLKAKIDAYLAENTPDIILNCANICAVKAAVIAENKTKPKKEAGSLIDFDVLGNIEFNYPAIPQELEALANACNFTEAVFFDVKTKAEMLKGKKIIVNTGPTEQPISDNGDVISNFSTGRQGFAIAAKLAELGAEVVLVHSNVNIPYPRHENIRLVEANTTTEMFEACKNQLPADGFIGVAAVADFGMDNPTDLKTTPNQPITLTLTQMPDILKFIGTHPTLRPKIVFGFAAETEDLIKYAQGKLTSKNADAIFANNVADAIGDKNNVICVTAAGVKESGLMPKPQAAGFVVNRMVAALKKKEVADARAVFDRYGLDLFKTAVTCVFHFKKERQQFVVLQRRKETDASGKHLLGIIGGYAKVSEQPDKAMLREFREEIIRPDGTPVITLNANKLVVKTPYMANNDGYPKIIIPYTYNLTPPEAQRLIGYAAQFASAEFTAGVAKASDGECFGIEIYELGQAMQIPVEEFAHASQHEKLLEICKELRVATLPRIFPVAR